VASFTILGEVTDADKRMNPLHWGSITAGSGDWLEAFRQVAAMAGSILADSGDGLKNSGRQRRWLEAFRQLAVMVWSIPAGSGDGWKHFDR